MTLLAQAQGRAEAGTEKTGPWPSGSRNLVCLRKKEYAWAPQPVNCACLLNPDDKEVRRIKGEALHKSM
jgi:hypothetical protein